MKRLRVENNVEKSDENDAMIPAKMPKACFKELTIRDVTLLRLIDGYEKSARWRRVIRQWMESYPLNSFEKCVRKLRSMHDFYGRKIIEEVMRDEDYAAIYRMVCEELGLKDSVEVAILVAMLPLNWKLRRVKGLHCIRAKTIIINCANIFQSLQQQSTSIMDDTELGQGFLRA
jgi:hypothetical protein